jgi:ADP-ribose pyrophosphatase YjhB (NUDIX family)
MEIDNYPIKREYPDSPVVGVGAVLIKEGRVLLVKRGKEPGYGSWSIPGGAVHLGEELAQAIEREVLEETGLVVEASPLIKVYVPVIRDEKGRVKYHYVLVDFMCRYVSGELRPASDVLDAAMVSPGELDKYRLPAATAALIEECLKAADSERLGGDF